jgi:hypothetical protein
MTILAREVNLLAVVEQFDPHHDNMELRIAGGLLCPRCATPVRCDPEPLSEPFAFRVVCTGCHADIISYRPA